MNTNCKENHNPTTPTEDKWYHIGTQEGFEDIPPAELYNCRKCHTTIAIPVKESK